MAGTHLWFSPIVNMIKAQIDSTKLVKHMLTFTSRYVFTLKLKSIYVETYYLQTNTSIKVNIRQTQSDTD